MNRDLVSRTEQPLRFSIFRLMLIVTVFAVLLAITRPLGIRIAFQISIPLAGVVLLADKRNAELIIRSVLWSGLGMFGGLLLCPPVMDEHPSGEPYRFMLLGAICGWLIGVTFTHRKTLAT